MDVNLFFQLKHPIPSFEEGDFLLISSENELFVALEVGNILYPDVWTNDALVGHILTPIELQEQYFRTLPIDLNQSMHQAYLHRPEAHGHRLSERVTAIILIYQEFIAL